MEMQDTVHRFFHDLSLNELQLMNRESGYPNITYNSLLYLDLIYYRKSCTASELAKLLHISKAAVTAKLNELIRQGFVVKRQNTQDKRRYDLSVSPDMEKIYRRFDKRLLTAFEQIERQFTREQMDCFCKVLAVLDRFYMEEADDEQTVKNL